MKGEENEKKNVTVKSQTVALLKSCRCCEQDWQCGGSHCSISMIAQLKAFELFVFRCQRSITMKNIFAETSETNLGLGGEKHHNITMAA